MRRFLALLAFLLSAVAPQLCLGQDVLAAHKVNALKGLRSIAVVLRHNTPREVASLKEWGDMIEVGLHRKVPDLMVSDTIKSSDWFELNIITTDAGGFVEICLYRWVRVLASGEDVFAKVWSESRATFGRASKQDVQEALDTLLTSFAADYLRSKR
jgi:hypothetical protein